jgi:predicted transcriptional regulator
VEAVARKKSPTLTEAELRLMQILWEKDSATVSEVAAALPKQQALAYSSVLTTLRILERKGYVKHVKSGRAFVYHSLIDCNDARRRVIRHLVSRFFNNSPELLVIKVIEHEKLNLDELKQLKKMVEASEP